MLRRFDLQNYTQRMTELTRQCLSLKRTERERLAKILQESLRRPDQTDDTRFQDLLRIVERILGGGIMTQSKSYNNTLGRRLIAYQMASEGYSYSSIGRMLNRSHSAVIHMCNLMEDAIKFAFRPEMTIWNRFQEIIKNYDETRKI